MSSQITYLDGVRLHRGLTAGMRQVLSRQDYLNKINVFPVPDGDTGTNMGFTLLSILDGTRGRVQSHAGQTATAIADAALDGARGNSGVILAQFFQGFSDSCAKVTRLDSTDFAKAATAGYEYALDALSEPVEGTILSVIWAAAQSLTRQASEGISDFVELLRHTLATAEEALSKTPQQLEILRKNGVVDAGGQGFVYILRGVLEFIQSGSLDQADVLPTISDIDGEAQISTEPGDSKFRWCTECLVVGSNIRRNKLREAILLLGDSLVMAGTKERAKIHIHTNQPNEIFAVASEYGTVSGEKADDMHQQIAVAAKPAGKVAVVTDSTADIPAELRERYNLNVVPVKLSFGNTRYLDKVTITPEEFFAEMMSNPDHPKTSQPTPGDFWRIYQFLTSHYDSIISVHLPRPVSGTIQSAEMACGRLPEASISVVDGVNTSVGLGLIAIVAAQAADAGKDHDEVLAVMQRAIEETHIFAAIHDLSYAVKGGRVTKSRKIISDLLRAVPVLSVTAERKVDRVGIFLGRKDIAGGLAKFTAKRVDLSKRYRVFISHAVCPEAADRLKEILPATGFETSEIYITKTGAALGAHAGPGSLIIALTPEELFQ